MKTLFNFLQKLILIAFLFGTIIITAQDTSVSYWSLGPRS